MNSEKTTRPSIRNIELRTHKMETNKIYLYQILPYIPKDNITELNELIYAGAKLVCEKTGIPKKALRKISNPGWEFQLETQIKNLRKQARMIKQKREAEICGNIK